MVRGLYGWRNVKEKITDQRRSLNNELEKQSAINERQNEEDFSPSM